MKFSINNFFSKCDQLITLSKECLIKNFIFVQYRNAFRSILVGTFLCQVFFFTDTENPQDNNERERNNLYFSYPPPLVFFARLLFFSIWRLKVSVYGHNFFGNCVSKQRYNKIQVQGIKSINFNRKLAPLQTFYQNFVEILRSEFAAEHI